VSRSSLASTPTVTSVKKTNTKKRMILCEVMAMMARANWSFLSGDSEEATPMDSDPK
jgi:hypothetical protein